MRENTKKIIFYISLIYSFNSFSMQLPENLQDYVKKADVIVLAKVNKVKFEKKDPWSNQLQKIQIETQVEQKIKGLGLLKNPIFLLYGTEHSVEIPKKGQSFIIFGEGINKDRQYKILKILKIKELYSIHIDIANSSCPVSIKHDALLLAILSIMKSQDKTINIEQKIKSIILSKEKASKTITSDSLIKRITLDEVNLEKGVDYINSRFEAVGIKTKIILEIQNPIEKPLSFDLHNPSPVAIAEIICKNLDLEYRVKGDKIIITKKETRDAVGGVGVQRNSD